MTLDARLAALQHRFLLGLELRLRDVATVLRGSGDPESLMRMFHSLAGIGGTYGFPRITEVSRRCESLCQKAIDEGRVISVVEKERFRRAVVQIDASREEAAHAA
jgi:chemotaxis protein histidine kinase CheA